MRPRQLTAGEYSAILTRTGARYSLSGVLGMATQARPSSLVLRHIVAIVGKLDQHQQPGPGIRGHPCECVHLQVLGQRLRGLRRHGALRLRCNAPVRNAVKKDSIVGLGATLGRASPGSLARRRFGAGRTEKCGRVKRESGGVDGNQRQPERCRHNMTSANQTRSRFRFGVELLTWWRCGPYGGRPDGSR